MVYVSIDESLNDGLGNGGIYLEVRPPKVVLTPSDDLAILKVSSGKAYVRGYDIETPGTVNLDAPKPRTTETQSSSCFIPFEMGSTVLCKQRNQYSSSWSRCC